MIFSYFLSFIYSLLNRRFLSGGTFFVKKELNSLNLYYLSDKISSSIFPVVYLSIMPFVFLTKYGKYPDDKTVEYMFIENFIIPDLWVNNKWSFTSVIKFSLYILSSVLNCCISRIRICGKTLFILNDNSNLIQMIHIKQLMKEEKNIICLKQIRILLYIQIKYIVFFFVKLSIYII